VRLDHLLSKERLQLFMFRVVWGVGVVRSRPIAQAFVLRWVLMGGISMNWCRVDAGWFEYGPHSFLLSGFVPGGGGVWFRERAGRGWFGYRLAHCWVLRQQGLDLLGGSARFVWGLPGGFGFWGFWFSWAWLPASWSCLLGLWGVGGVLLGLLFENCIVDASILKRSNF
jgi:hypothetical protein